MSPGDDTTLRNAGQDGEENDDRLWLNTVLEGLGERSDEVRRALAEALRDGGNDGQTTPHLSGTTSTTPASKYPQKSATDETSSTSHVSGTTSLKTADFQRSSQRSRDNCDTRTYHTTPLASSANHWNGNVSTDHNCRTLV